MATVVNTSQKGFQHQKLQSCLLYFYLIQYLTKCRMGSSGPASSLASNSFVLSVSESTEKLSVCFLRVKELKDEMETLKNRATAAERNAAAMDAQRKAAMAEKSAFVKEVCFQLLCWFCVKSIGIYISLNTCVVWKEG